MKTLDFINKNYQKEINRINREIEEVIPKIEEEAELLALFRKMYNNQVYRDGEISILFYSDGYSSFRCQQPASYTYSNPQDIFSYSPSKGIIHNDQFTLEEYHLKTLKGIHPKRFPELIRAGAKKYLLAEEQPATKPWWKFW